MKRQKPDVLHQFGLFLGVSVWLIFACGRILDANEPPPQVSKDGLQLQKQSKQRLVYLKPGATFSQYDRVAILDCYVEFGRTGRGITTRNTRAWKIGSPTRISSG